MSWLDRFFDIGGDDDAPAEVSDRVLTVPNALSVARILILPLVVYDLVGERFLRALIVLAVFAATDWLDGYVARRFGQVSRLGQLLDPISDRTLFLIVGIGLVVADLLPLWALLVILVRDGLVMGAGALMLSSGARPPAVTRIGKTSTFALMFAFPAFLGAAVIGAGAGDPEPIVQGIAWALFAVGAVLHWTSAGQYLQAVLRERANESGDGDDRR